MATKNHNEAIVKKVSRKHDEHGHGGAWKVAFADFCLALLCLFLVLWLLASRNTERMQQVLKNAGINNVMETNGEGTSIESGYQGSLIERFPIPSRGEASDRGNGKDANEQSPAQPVKRARLETPAELNTLAKIIERIGAEEGLAANISAVVTPEGLRLMLHDTDSRGMFERGSAVPSQRLKTLLRRLGGVFAKVENQMQIVGHTDAYQYADKGPGSFSNSALSANRAMSARIHLLEGGMPENSVLQVTGMADQAPLDAGNPKASFNRRIELLILTANQARALVDMFATPRSVKPLIDGVDSASPKDPALLELRTRLSQERPAKKAPTESIEN